MRPPGVVAITARGNTHGFTQVALAIASGFPGTRATPLSYGEARIPGIDPGRLRVSA